VRKAVSVAAGESAGDAKCRENLQTGPRVQMGLRSIPAAAPPFRSTKGSGHLGRPRLTPPGAVRLS